MSSSQQSFPWGLRMCSVVKQMVRNKRGGFALILAMIFVLIFSILAVGIAAISGANAQIANNYRHANRALESAQSGLEVIRYYLDGMNTQASVYKVFLNLHTNLGATYDFIHEDIVVPSTVIDSSSGLSFSARVHYIDPNALQVDITGQSENISRTVRTQFEFAEQAHTVFDFGVATKGPLDMSGQAEIEGVNEVDIAIEAGVYIEGIPGSSGDSFSITNNASIAGNVSIADPDASYDVGSKAMIGGIKGDQNVTVGVPYVDFPEPDPEYFRQYATGDVIDANYDFAHDAVLNNATVAANTNPTFASHVTINGVLFIEQPNQIHFAGQSTINGIIVGNGNLDDPVASCIKFSGQVTSNDVSVLEGYEFEAMQGETGTFIMAPGFELEFSGQANHMNGAIASSGITFSGQAGGTINGSIINYSEDVMSLGGQSTLTFNRSGTSKNPAGFQAVHILVFRPTTYSEVVL